MGIRIGLGRWLYYQKVMYVDRGFDLLGKNQILDFLLGKFNGADKCKILTWLPKKIWEG